VSVNLSLASLTDAMLADRITAIVRSARLDPRHMTLEITESAAMSNVASALENLARLRMHGFGLSIDDYGTGYASMQQLTRIPFTELKIDQGFVTGCVANHATRAIVESSVGMAHRLGIKSVAEGVETQSDWDALKAVSCDIAQGYFIAKPMDASSFVEFGATYKPG
jgi:EAL domain-containing protein (putative c-di-GMP-specific phosphodiesterase class I)